MCVPSFQLQSYSQLQTLELLKQACVNSVTQDHPRQKDKAQRKADLGLE